MTKNRTLASATLVLLGAAAGGAHEAGAQTLPAPPASPAPVVALEYDALGNPTRQTLAPGVAGLNHATTHQYDRLSRRTRTTDARSGSVRLDYTARDELVQLTDPRNLVTQYPRNGLGDALALVSPDTGTATHTYDAAGNLLTRTDSRGALATYSYDALNRLRDLIYSRSGSGDVDRIFAWLYDQTGPSFGFGIGRMTTAHFPDGFTTYGYDAQGRVVRSTQTVNAGSGPVALSTGYGYDAAGRLIDITYPSGRVLRISRSGGQATALALAPDAGAAGLPLVSGIQAEPAPGGQGALRSWTWQMASGSLAHQRSFDTWGRIVRYPLGGAVRDLLYDAADRIVGYRHLEAATGTATPAAQALDQSFGYDELGRLVSIVTSVGQWTIAYDANGNRTAVTHSAGGPVQTRNYLVAAASNRLEGLSNPVRTIGYDAAGNFTSDTGDGIGLTTYHDASNRLAGISAWGPGGTRRDVNMSYNAQGQRVAKVVQGGGPRTMFVYDLEGRLLGEYDASTGAVRREYVWLGDTPMAVVDGTPAAQVVYYVHADHLDAPRVLIDRAGNQRWSWVAEPFGNSAPVTSPVGLAAVELNLRFPGQYFDQETGLSYNWHRDYDASIGRYTQSDPIGLVGGINTYAYVGGNPVSYVDPDGLRGGAVGSAPLQLTYNPGIRAPGAQPVVPPFGGLPPSPASGYQSRVTTWENFGDGLGAMSGAGASIRHPSVPNALEDLVNPRRWLRRDPQPWLELPKPICPK
jgi:RHS repeat-associated protein